MSLKFIKLFEDFNRNVQSKIDVILDKISDNGIESLTPDEKHFLETQQELNPQPEPEPAPYKDSYADDEEMDKFADFLNTGDDLDNLEINCDLPILKRYKITFIAQELEDTTIYGELIITPLYERNEIYFNGNLESDSDFNYLGYAFDYVNDNGEPDETVFDKMIEKDHDLKNNIETFFENVVNVVKSKIKR